MKKQFFIPRVIRLIVTGIITSIVCLNFVGCATNDVTKPDTFALSGSGYQENIIAIMPVGKANPMYKSYLSELNKKWFLNRWIYGAGEVSTLKDPYEDFALAIYNRFRGYDIFGRAVIVDSREEADKLRAQYLLCFSINDCYAVGRGANWNFVEWCTSEGIIDVDVVVYDLIKNERISNQNIKANAFNTYVWTSGEMQDYLQKKLLKGVTFNNAIAQINF